MQKLNLILLTITTLFLNACENNLKEVVELSKNQEPAAEIVEGVRLIYSEQAHVKVLLEAPELKRTKNDNATAEFVKGITIQFFNDSLQIISTIKANYAIRNEQERTTIAKQEVQWNNTKNEHLETEELIWDEKAGKIYSNVFVKITTPTQTLTGNSFEAEQDFSRYKITKTSGSVKVNPNQYNIE